MPVAHDAGMTTTRSHETATDLRAEWRDGVVAALTMLVGFVPFALVIGATVGAHGPVVARLASTPLVLGGSAQLAVLELLDDGGAMALVIGTGLAINARLLTYSASLAPEWAGASRRFRLVAAATIIDPTWALSRERAARGGSFEARRSFYAAMASVMVLGWTGLVSLGAAIGPAVDLAAMDVAVPLCLLVLVVPNLTTRPGAAGVAAAALVGWGATAAPAGSGVLLAALAGVLVAELVERQVPR
jgi:predicted branched-subunit amino acid permease